MSWHSRRILKENLAVIRYGEEQVGREKGKSDWATVIVKEPLAGDMTCKKR